MLPFPRVLVHEGLSGGGSPLVVGNTVDPVIVDKIAKFGYWCCQPGFLYQSQRFALDAIRAKNPNIKILVHFVLHSVWGTPGADTGYQSRYAEICARPGGVYMNINGTKTTTPNLTNPKRLEEFIALWLDVLNSGAYDGVMMDPMCAVTPPSNVDWTDGGRFHSLDELYIAQNAAHGLIIASIRKKFGKSFIIVGCGGPKGNYAGGDLASGWWQENYPNQNPIGWIPCTDLVVDSTSYYTPPIFNVIAYARDSMDTRAAHMGLATSCLGECAFTIGPGNWKGNIYYDWWLNEYGIDRASGKPMGFANGWLGNPLEDMRVTDNGLWVREFQYGYVAVNPDTESQIAEHSENLFTPIGTTTWIVSPNNATFWRRL